MSDSGENLPDDSGSMDAFEENLDATEDLDDVEDDKVSATTISDVLDNALKNLQWAIEDLMMLMGEVGEDAILTDFVVLAVSQGFTEDGRPMSSPTTLLPKRFQPQHRTKGLLVDGLDQMRLTEQAMLRFQEIDLGDDDDDE